MVEEALLLVLEIQGHRVTKVEPSFIDSQDERFSLLKTHQTLQKERNIILLCVTFIGH